MLTTSRMTHCSSFDDFKFFKGVQIPQIILSLVPMLCEFLRLAPPRLKCPSKRAPHCFWRIRGEGHQVQLSSRKHLHLLASSPGPANSSKVLLLSSLFLPKSCGLLYRSLKHHFLLCCSLLTRYHRQIRIGVPQGS